MASVTIGNESVVGSSFAQSLQDPYGGGYRYHRCVVCRVHAPRGGASATGARLAGGESQTAQMGLERLAELLRRTTLEQLHREERQMLLLREQLSVSPHTLLRNLHATRVTTWERLASTARYLPMRYQLQWRRS